MLKNFGAGEPVKPALAGLAHHMGKGSMKKLLVVSSLTLSLLAVSFLAACGSKGGDAPTGKAIKSAPAGNNLTATLSNEDGQLKHGDEEFTLSFTDATGKPVDVGAVSLTFHMPAMGTMAVMNDPATFTTTDTPGLYRGKAKIEMAGEWQAQITYEGGAGKGKVTIPVVAQ